MCNILLNLKVLKTNCFWKYEDQAFTDLLFKMRDKMTGCLNISLSSFSLMKKKQKIKVGKNHRQLPLLC